MTILVHTKVLAERVSKKGGYRVNEKVRTTLLMLQLLEHPVVVVSDRLRLVVSTGLDFTYPMFGGEFGYIKCSSWESLKLLMGDIYICTELPPKPENFGRIILVKENTDWKQIFKELT